MAKTRTEIQAKYDAQNRKTYSIKLHVKNDADIIEKFASVPSLMGYIKQLVRKDINDSVPETEQYKVFIPGKQDLPSNSDKVKCLMAIAKQSGIEQELLSELIRSVPETKRE